MSIFIKVVFRVTILPETNPIVSIENVVASATVDQKMDLNAITKNFPDVE